MTTTILESKVTIGGKVFNLINTDMELLVDWDILLSKKDSTAEISIQFNSVYGSFNYKEQKEGYQKKTTISFKSDNTWKVSGFVNDINNGVLIPIISKIDFDTKTIQIYF